MNERQSNLRGIGLTLLSSVLFATSNAAAKWVMTGLPSGELLWARGLVAFLIVCLFIRRDEWAGLWTGGQLHLHALRMVTSAIDVMCFYWAIARTPLADMTTIYLAMPIYVTAMAALFLGEQVGWRRWSAVIAGFVGVVIAVNPGAGSLSTPALVAVIGSVVYSASIIFTRRLRATPSTVLVATQMAMLCLMSATTAALGWVVPSTEQFVLMGLIGLIAMVAFWCQNQGLRLAAASVAAPFNYTSIIWAAAFGLVLFGDVPATRTLVGAAIIVGAGLFILFRESQKPGKTAS
jgi:drug/metabolite transporter (DMT)-like permease